ncbi:ASCH domain-containing protein [Candidatus Amesbacteria bacterium]|nr:ASCH domain-containing protein [Candidatus Amesbacteria bacterium]
MKLGFSEDLIPSVLDGSKTETYRLGFKYNFLEVDDLVEIENSQTKELNGTAVITLKEKVTFIDVPTKFSETREELRKRLETYYNTKIVDDDSFLKLSFRLYY